MDGEVVDHDVVAGLLNTLVKRFKFPREDTALVYSSRRMVFREADFPYMSLNDLKSTLPFQAKGMIPLPTEESGARLRAIERHRQRTRQTVARHTRGDIA